jgi:hypothetical protein
VVHQRAGVFHTHASLSIHSLRCNRGKLFPVSRLGKTTPFTQHAALQIVEWLDAHYSTMDPEEYKELKERFQSQDPDADIGL